MSSMGRSVTKLMCVCVRACVFFISVIYRGAPVCVAVARLTAQYINYAKTTYNGQCHLRLMSLRVRDTQLVWFPGMFEWHVCVSSLFQFVQVKLLRYFLVPARWKTDRSVISRCFATEFNKTSIGYFLILQTGQFMAIIKAKIIINNNYDKLIHRKYRNKETKRKRNKKLTCQTHCAIHYII